MQRIFRTKFQHALLGVTLLLALRGAALARNVSATDDFTNESLAGQYALTLTGQGGRAPTAGVGIVTCDAQGNFTGTAKYNVVNQQTGERTFLEFPTSGVFTLNPDGTGKLVFTNAGVVVKEAVFVVTSAERRAVRFGQQILPGEKVAREIALVAKELNLQGHLLTGVATRLDQNRER